MLRAAHQLLQMAHLLLQQGEQGQGSRVEEVKAKVGKFSVACQTDYDEEESAELARTAATDASRNIACQTELEPEEMEAHNDSSGYGSDVSSLDEEESRDDTSSESGVPFLTSSPCKGLSSSNVSSQLMPSSAEEEQQEEEQQEEEVSSEEEPPCVPVHDQAV